MPKYRTEPPISGIFIPDLGPYQADENGIFDLPQNHLVERAVAAVNVRLVEVVEDPASATPAGAGDPAATVEGGDSISGAAEPSSAEGADTTAGAEAQATKQKKTKAG